MAIRASYGMNGIIIRSADLRTFGDYMLANQARRPPDHLVVEWFAGEKEATKQMKAGRAHLAFRHNILNHLGVVSTLRAAKSKAFPTCYEELGEPTLFKVEAFDFKACKNDDIWPCDVPDNVKTGKLGWQMLCTGELCLKEERDRMKLKQFR